MWNWESKPAHAADARMGWVGCRRFRDANPEEIEALTLEGMREAVMAQLHPANIEINLVGDIDLAEVDDVILRYLGTVAPRNTPPPPPRVQPPGICYPPAHIRRQAWHLKARSKVVLAASQALHWTGLSITCCHACLLLIYGQKY